MQILPITNDYSQIFNTVLNDQDVEIKVWYQDIGEGWFLSMSFVNGDDIILGARINTGSPIMTSVFSDFIGNLICVSSVVKTDEPGKTDPWGNTHQLLYLTPDEAEEVGIE